MPKISGLYAITPTHLAGSPVLSQKVAAALRGGARVVQYRDKSGDSRRRRTEALRIARLCHEADACFIVNDDVELALEVDADGVHLGKDDFGIARARAALGPTKLIGASCYDQPVLARRAVAEGADYVAFGSFFDSSTKPRAVRAHPDMLAQARAEIAVPLVAIGGISPQNGAQLIAAGADALAVSRALFDVDDPQCVARQFEYLFKTSARQKLAT